MFRLSFVVRREGFYFNFNRGNVYFMKMTKYDYYRFRYVNGQYLPLSAPVDVSLELSSFCNMRCTYCYHADKKNMPFKQNLMTWETAKKILEESAEIGVNSLKMNWRGESSMNPIFYQVCSTAKKLAKNLTFIDRITNSNFKFDSNKNEIFDALACQTKVKVSYDSFRKDVFEKQRAGGNHDITTTNIDKFYNWPGRDNEIVIQAVRTTANKDEDFESELKKRWPSASLSVRDVAPGRSEKDYDDLLVREEQKERIPCKQAFVRLIFAWNGDASPCCPNIGMKINLGNVHKYSVKEIFNNELARTLREDLKTGKAFELDPCKTCSSHESFAGYEAPLES
jgi:radical SAM protein with 4Fe4S-binding SPASM domain